ncbi:hypothetical protein ACFV6U_34590 [Streptomyces sp. NPDC059810]|uniref:hypothetical protein n=1 Tax=Streptomyces sp. NPDC059810 TaxID=3346956 RepID=UPI0036473927
MFRIVRTATLRLLDAQIVDLADQRDNARLCRAKAEDARDSALRHQARAEAARDYATTEIARLTGEADALRGVIASRAETTDAVRSIGLKLAADTLDDKLGDEYRARVARSLLNSAQVLGLGLPAEFTRLLGELAAAAGTAEPMPEAVER